LGLKNYLYLTDNLRKIEAVWLKIPILINGRYEKAGIITPDGKIEVVNFESAAKNYGLFTGEIKY
jgi:phosphoribosylaminoimidazole-succinocarboxamide synthase